jgi:hypothetical protein
MGDRLPSNSDPLIYVERSPDVKLDALLYAARMMKIFKTSYALSPYVVHLLY